MSVRQVPAGEASRHSSAKIRSVTVPVGIVGVVLRSGKVVSFAGSSAAYYRGLAVIEGRDKDKVLMAFGVDTLVSVQVRRAGAPEAETTELSMAALLKTAAERSTVRSKGIVYPLWDTLSFNAEGGRFDRARGVVSGVTSDGKFIEIARDDLLAIRADELDGGKTTTAIILGLVIVAVAVVVVAHLPFKAEGPSGGGR